jgi:hypothetical protein
MPIRPRGNRWFLATKKEKKEKEITIVFALFLISNP